MKGVSKFLVPGISLFVISCGGTDNPISTTASDTSTSSSTTSSTPPTSTTTSTICQSTEETETIPFTLPPAGEDPAFDVGPFSVGPGNVSGEMRFTRGYIMCTCIGTATACRPFCGPGPKVEFRLDVPRDYPAGELTASIYYNTNFSQPSGGASGQFMITYRTYCP